MKKSVKITIIILSILLALSIAALIVTVVRNHRSAAKEYSVLVPDNIITPEEEDSADSDDSSAQSGTSATARTRNVDDALTISRGSSRDSFTFQVENMFPGDSITKYYAVSVHHDGAVTLRFHADVRPGGEKLSEALCVRIHVSGAVDDLYDGPIGAMPSSVNYPLDAYDSAHEDTLLYEITAYLDTSTGNEYQDLGLIADFNWWVEETGNLSPKTGDTANILLWTAVAVDAAGLMLLLLLLRRRKESRDEC